MDAEFAICELTRQVRESTLNLLSRAEPQWLLWAPPGTSNHLLWHAGHALWLQDVLCLEAVTGRSELPSGWEDMFGMDCRPVKETTSWPPVEEVRRLLEAQLPRIYAVVREAGDSRLAEIVNERGSTLAGRIIHGLHDEARHQGEMLLLMKLCIANLSAK
jgi:hypothetical protein